MKRFQAVPWILLFAAAQAGAVECRPPATLSEGIAARHEYVVKARVVRVRPPADNGVLPVMFSVLRKYRGNAPQVLTIDFDPRHDPRPLSFHPGEIFLVSAWPARNGDSARGIGDACTLRQLVDVR